jgi:hypothetical protein
VSEEEEEEVEVEVKVQGWVTNLHLPLIWRVLFLETLQSHPFKRI